MVKVIGLRSKRNVSQHRLAALSGVSRYRISMAECGYLLLTEQEVEAIKKALEKVEASKNDLLVLGHESEQQQD